MVQKVQIKRTSTPNSPPVGLDPGELAVEMSDPTKLWVGVPVSMNPNQRKLLSYNVIVADAPPADINTGQLWWENDTGIMWLWYNDGTSSQWVQISGGGGAGGGTAPEDIWVDTTGDTMTGPLTVEGANVLINNGALAVRGSGIASFTDGAANQLSLINTIAYAGGHMGASLSVDNVGRVIWNNSSGNLGLHLYANGVPCANFTSQGMYIAPAQGTYAIDARGVSYGSGVIGWSTGVSGYGVSGCYAAPNVWSFFGNTSAYLSAGSWTASDERLKNVGVELDRAAALAAVNAIAVKQFTPKNSYAKTMLYGNTELTGPLFGWIAQEVEELIPTAVMDVSYPAHDIAARATLKGIAIPDKNTPEAMALGAEDIPLKAINDRYMIATLWAAVQQLSAEIEALKAGT